MTLEWFTLVYAQRPRFPVVAHAVWVDASMTRHQRQRLRARCGYIPSKKQNLWNAVHSPDQQRCTRCLQALAAFEKRKAKR